jgi:hypothetical protein
MVYNTVPLVKYSTGDIQKSIYIIRTFIHKKILDNASTEQGWQGAPDPELMWLQSNCVTTIR